MLSLQKVHFVRDSFIQTGKQNSQTYLSRHIYLFPEVFHHWVQTGWLKTREIHFLTVWRLAVWNQGAGRAMLPNKPAGENLSLTLLTSVGCKQSLTPTFVEPTSAWGILVLLVHHSNLCLHHLVAVFCVSLCLWLFSFYDDTSPIVLRAYLTLLWPCLNNCICNDLISK